MSIVDVRRIREAPRTEKKGCPHKMSCVAHQSSRNRSQMKTNMKLNRDDDDDDDHCICGFLIVLFASLSASLSSSVSLSIFLRFFVLAAT